MVPLLRPARRVYSKDPTWPALTARANSGRLAAWHRLGATLTWLGTQPISRGEEMSHLHIPRTAASRIGASLAVLVWLGVSGASPNEHGEARSDPGSGRPWNVEVTHLF